jgi:hypothetical protein
MAQYHDERRTKMFGSVLDAPQYDRVGDIAGYPHHENFTQALVKDYFGRDTGIGAGEDNGLRLL